MQATPDSYIKLALDVFPNYMSDTGLFAPVHVEDREEVAIAFAQFCVGELDNCADSFRITPTDRYGYENRDEHYAKQTCCGCADTLIRCRAGRSYFAGFNYGH